MDQSCEHLDQIVDGIKPKISRGCEECLKIRQAWVHLRLCMSCGHIGCCDQSIGKHATKHFHATKHPSIQSFQPGEDWMWCYVDEVYIE